MPDPFGTGSRHASGCKVRHGRPKASRLLAGAAAVLLVATAISCSPSHSGSPTAPTAPTAPSSGTTSSPYAIWTPKAVVIPTGGLDPYVQCLVDAGWKIVAVHPEMSPHPGYDMTYPGQMGSDAQARTQQCQALMPPPVWPSDDEVRAIYKRDVDEYHCLIGLGYQPDPPPSVETFVANWRTGPWWEPYDGTGFEGWTYAQWQQAHEKCTLESLPDPPNP